MKCLMDHIVLNVKDVERMLTFYTAVLEFSSERLTEFKEGTVSFPSVRLNEDTVIDLFPASIWSSSDGTTASGTAPNLNHFCIVVDKAAWNNLQDQLRHNDIEIEQGPVERWGAHGSGCSIYFRDPEHNVIEARYYAEEHQSTEGCLLAT